MSETYYCGPLEVIVLTDEPVLHDKVEETLDLYNVNWDAPALSIHLNIRKSSSPGEKLNGSYLESYRMWVDATTEGLRVFFSLGGTVNIILLKISGR